MAKRRIKDARDLTTGELIYFRGHAKATYLSDGSTLEEKISNIEENIGKESIISITYSDLVDLRNNSELNPEQKYRIIDYVTTTSQSNTQSAGHQFDLIVVALSENTLSEDAKAIQNENDGYFDEFNLEAWELKYCLDNDTSRFAWAVTDTVVNSENVNIIDTLITDNEFNEPFLPDYYIYIDTAGNNFNRYVQGDGMRDSDFFIEYGRETSPDGLENQLCIYKNDLSDENYIEGGEEEGVDYADKFFYWGTEEVDGIIYDKWKKSEVGYGWNIIEGGGSFFILTQRITTGEIIEEGNNGKGVIYYMKDEFNNECPYDFKNIKFYREEQDNRYLFTFSWINENEDVEDLTLRQDLLSDDGTAYGTHDNIIKTYYNRNRQQLNDVTFVSSYLYDSGLFYGCVSNRFGNDCYSNSFGNNCRDNRFGNDCYSNSFGNNCSSNSFGNNCRDNKFDSNCEYNSFGNGCYYNSLGNDCYYNSFGNDYYYNSLGNNCTSNSFGNRCRNNSFGNDCYYNSLGNSCYSNSFGNNCNSNSFGNDCYSNSFGGSCHNNSFGNDCRDNRFGGSCYSNSFCNYCYSNKFDSNCEYNSLGNNCRNNSFGNNCDSNSFGNDCSSNSFGNYCTSNSFGNRCNEISLGYDCDSNSFGNDCLRVKFTIRLDEDNLASNIYNNQLGNSCEDLNIGIEYGESGEYLQNIVISSGLSNAEIGLDCYNRDYETRIARNSNGEIKIYCEADLIG